MMKCPECGKPAEAKVSPFCSTRCQQIDLGRWLKGDYVIPGSRDEGAAPNPGPSASEDEE